MIVTPLAEHTIYRLAAALMEQAPGYGDCARIDRALDLVSGVERTAFPTVYLVRSASEPDRAYTVRNAQCNCADTPRERGATHCKHAWAVVLFNLLERVEADAEAPITITVAAEDSILDLWPLDGEHADLAPQCSRCAAEPRTTRHPDGLGMVCIAGELGMGEEA